MKMSLRQCKDANKGAESGKHGDPYFKAAKGLRERAKNKDNLPEFNKTLLKKAEEFEQKGREVNHRGGRTGRGRK